MDRIKSVKKSWVSMGALAVLIIALFSAFYLSSFTSAAPCPCNIWSDSETPAQPNVADGSPIELGVKFKSSVSGAVTGVRFYKGVNNTGTHIGSLWSSDGTRITHATFENESASGWQQVTFASPVAISAGTTYVASYHSPNGSYSATQNYFAVDRENSPLTAPSSSSSNGNGVYTYGGAGTFPTSSYNSTNYWVDVVFDADSDADSVAPTVTSVTPANNATNIGQAANLSVVFSEVLSTGSVSSSTIEVRDSADQVVPASVTYSEGNSTATINPNDNLAANSTYSVIIKGGSTDPRIKDAAGNALAQNYTWTFTTSSTYCGSLNEIACENTRAGNPATQWDIGETAGDSSIQGFATDISVNRGSTVDFKIKTPSTNYNIDIYRLGYYNGDGARKITTVNPSATLPQTQPECLSEAATGLIDCGNWGVSANWSVPSDAVSGVYLAHLKRQDAPGSSHVIFVVRNDASTSDILYQTSDTTWGAAYNDYGGNSLYAGSPAGRAYKVSYNRPVNTRSTTYKRTHFFANEQPMIRWVESNGYDVSYSTGVDTHRQPVSVLQQHKMFLSSGHDEYWSKTQRTNVEAARDAGVNLSFFSGNEVFWKTRFENSMDGSGTPNRTMVTYKETLASSKIDPSSEWTGTWRDARFSPPSDGGRPENSLTGQIFTVNCCVVGAVQVPEEDGKLRFWRNTSVANQAANGVATLAAGTIGFEADEDLDNGLRPAGLVRLSKTPLTNVNKLQNNGSVYANGNATHSITFYKAPSGATVFGAGTVRWSWGLDGTHDDTASSPGTAPSLAMKQATVNLFADMDIQPTTLQTGLVAAAKTTDTTGPTSTLTTPASNETIQAGTPFTISGTATDVGGRVGGVEVSVDGGTTWKRANGREDWNYDHTFTGSGTASIVVRASDDSGNVGTSSAATGVTITPATSVTLFSPTSTPAESTTDTDPIELGLKFKSDTSGTVTGVRFYKGTGNTGTHIGNLWAADGTNLGQVTFENETSSGWQQANFATPIPISANTTYVISYYSPTGRFSATRQQFIGSTVDNPPLHAPADETSGGNGVFRYGSSTIFPNQSFNATNYWVDVVFSPNGSAPADSEAPTAPTNVSATANSATQVTVSWTGSTDNTGVTGYKVYRNGTQVGIATSTSYVDTSVNASTSYSYTVRANDAAGNNSALSSEANVITPTPTASNLSIFSPTSVPAIANNSDGTAMEFGVKFRSDDAGQITGVRFYKGSNNTGTHIGSLWSSNGTKLASVTFTNETASGWQQANFDSPVSIDANTTYVVSYHSPGGNFSATWEQFSNSGIDNGPLHVPAHSTVGGNGVFAYGAASTFPTQSNNGGNYWVDVVFSQGGNTGDTQSPTTPTGVTATASSATQVTVSWTASTDNVGVSGYRIYRNGTQIGTSAGTSYTDSTASPSTAYSYTVRAQDAAANISPVSNSASATTPAGTTSNTSIFSPTSVPAIANNSDGTAMEFGVKFRSDVAGQVTGVRFYKGTANTGTHIGSLWSSTGTKLASVTFTDETTSGWQQANFDTPVSIDANTTYVVSYHSPGGNFSATWSQFGSAVDNAPLHALSHGESGGNGVFGYGAASTFPTQSNNGGNYWVDVVFSQGGSSGDSEAPTAPTNVSATANSATQVSVSWTASTDNTGVTGYKVYRNGTQVGTATSTSYVDATVSASTAYTYTVRANDAAGNQSAASAGASVTTPGGTVKSVFSASATPAVAATDDSSAVEVGMKFRSDKAGKITGVRFYKGTANTGTHVGNLWKTDGTLLASVTFTNETASGWQQANFSTPVSIEANTTYVVSYYAPNGRFAVTWEQFYSEGIDNGSLHVPSHIAGGGNGVFAYGSNSAFPSQSYNGGNYWVDVVYEPHNETVFDASSTPANLSVNEANPVEVGMKFRSDVAGKVTGVRFYKSAANTGTHTGTLWSASGTQLATVTFTNETASGWQQADFSTPVDIAANTTYVVSYFAPNGNYSYTSGQFNTAVTGTGSHLQGLANGTDGGNGVYFYTSTSSFPAYSFNATNYWVDVVFEATQ